MRGYFRFRLGLGYIDGPWLKLPDKVETEGENPPSGVEFSVQVRL